MPEGRLQWVLTIVAIALTACIVVGVATACVGNYQRYHKPSTVFPIYLGSLRCSVSAYQRDKGHCPAKLTDLVGSWEYDPSVPKPKDMIRADTGTYLHGGNGIRRTSLPANPYASRDTGIGTLDDEIGRNWRYDATSGTVSSAVDGVDGNGRRLREF
jgi:hypothetical protein